METTVALTGANLIAQGVQLNNNFFTFAGTQPIEIAGSTIGYSLMNNGGTTLNSTTDRRFYNNLTAGSALTFSTQPVLLSDSTTISRTLTFAGSGSTVISGAVTPMTAAVAGVASGLNYLGRARCRSRPSIPSEDRLR